MAEWWHNFNFLTDFEVSKRVLRSIFVFFSKIWPRTCIAGLYPETFGLTFFTCWPEMTLTYYGQKAQEMILTNVRDTLSTPIPWLRLRLTSKFAHANVTKPEKSNIPTLNRPVTSSLTSRSILTPFLKGSQTWKYRIRVSTRSQSLHNHYLKTLGESWEVKSTRDSARLFCSSTQSYAICLNDA